MSNPLAEVATLFSGLFRTQASARDTNDAMSETAAKTNSTAWTVVRYLASAAYTGCIWFKDRVVEKATEGDFHDRARFWGLFVGGAFVVAIGCSVPILGKPIIIMGVVMIGWSLV